MRGLSPGFPLQPGLSKAIAVVGLLNAAPESPAVSELWDQCGEETAKFIPWLWSAAMLFSASSQTCRCKRGQEWHCFGAEASTDDAGAVSEPRGAMLPVGTSQALPCASGGCPCSAAQQEHGITVVIAIALPSETFCSATLKRN